MAGELEAAIIGAGVATAGWVVTYFQQQIAKAKEEKRRFLRRQVEEFYSPLHALVKKKESVQKVQDERLKTLEGDPWVRALRFFSDHHIDPTMQAIASILMEKSYLAVDWPQSFDQFLEHQSQSIALYQLWRNEGIPGDVETVKWPGQLEGDLRIRRDRLEQKLRDQYGAGGGTAGADADGSFALRDVKSDV